jgi:hypothetical protein
MPAWMKALDVLRCWARIRSSERRAVAVARAVEAQGCARAPLAACGGEVGLIR